MRRGAHRTSEPVSRGTKGKNKRPGFLKYLISPIFAVSSHVWCFELSDQINQRSQRNLLLYERSRGLDEPGVALRRSGFIHAINDPTDIGEGAQQHEQVKRVRVECPFALVAVNESCFEIVEIGLGPVFEQECRHIEQPKTPTAVIKVDQANLVAIDHYVFADEIGMDQAIIERILTVR